MRKRLTMAIAIALTVFAAPAFAVDISDSVLRAAGLSRVREGTKMIDFELDALEGGKTKLSDHAGKVVFLNFWATWCPPCRAEMPSMQVLSDRLKDKGLVILAVDLREGPELVKPFMEEFGLDFPVLLDRTGSVGARYGVRSIPTTYIIDRDGIIVAGRIGGQEWDSDEVIAFFEQLLEQ